MINKPISNDDELKAMLQSLEMIFQAEANTPEAKEMEMLVTLIEAYENKHYAIIPNDSAKASKFRRKHNRDWPEMKNPNVAFKCRVGTNSRRFRRCFSAFMPTGTPFFSQ